MSKNQITLLAFRYLERPYKEDYFDVFRPVDFWSFIENAYLGLPESCQGRGEMTFLEKTIANKELLGLGKTKNAK